MCLSVVAFSLAAALECEKAELERAKANREREIESLQQQHCEAVRGTSDVLSQAVEDQRCQYETKLKQLQWELAEQKMKALLTEHSQQPASAVTEQVI